MDNIIKLLTANVTPQLIEKLSHSLGEKESGLGLALPSVFPVVLEQVRNYLKHSNSSHEFIAELDEIPEFNINSLIDGNHHQSDKLSSLMSMITNRMPEITDKVASVFNLNGSSAKMLLTVASGMVMNTLRDYVNNRATQSISLKGWLSSQAHLISSELPVQFQSFSSDEVIKQNTVKVAAPAKPLLNPDAPIRPTPKLAEKKKGCGKWWLLLLLLLILAAAYFLRSCSTTKESTPVEITPPAATTQVTTGSLWGNLGDFFRKLLPDGKELNIPQYGVENKLIEFIESTLPVDSTTWFSFDRLLFKTNSAQLEPQSDEQLNNIVAILKAYPNVKLKLGGYTDNTGTEEINLKLSQDRADSVRAQMIQLGADASRLEAKGYGSEHPVAPNDTDENRAKNRRIDILVIEK
ncbi:OmpA family protein [Limnobaculum parvum]|uniref:OmpA family protein n=1 Tax=Limnobaculum parvum TaxID=2172103 RepID=A0A2Y9U0V9_9GAMM|nr:OmpA family protein [Limnobaculum parvum]AWH89400.1 OmpA family protein [Limnobaculum parvum]